MKYSTNYNMNKPELSEQYRLEHWNNNTDIIDTELKKNADNIETAETALQNAINEESSRATTAETALRNITDSTFKTALLNFCYPVGSLYWSSNSTDPSTLFGGTWTPIKDCFVWAKGDNDTVNATGGSKTVTLTEQQIPNHTHTFTGTAVTSGRSSATNTGSESSHTHSVTASGSISVTTNPTFTGTAVDSGANNRGHTHAQNIQGGSEVNQYAWVAGERSGSSKGATINANAYNVNYGQLFSNKYRLITDGESQNHTHSVTAKGTISGGAYKFTGSSVTSGAGSSHSHTMAHTHSVTASGTNSSTGGGQAHDNMPPYIVKYCWERTA